MAKTNNVGQSLTQKPLPSSNTMRPQNSFYKKAGDTLKEVISPSNILTSCKDARDLAALDSTTA